MLAYPHLLLTRLPMLRRVLLALVFAFLLFPTLTASAQTGATLSGRVTNNKGEPVANAVVVLFQKADEPFVGWVSFIDVQSNANGDYAFTDIPPNTYRLGTYAPTEAYWTIYYGNAESVESADDVGITAGATLTGYNMTLPNAAHVVGKVLAPDNGPLSGIGVIGIYQIDVGIGLVDQVERTTHTDEDGAFDLIINSREPHWLSFVNNAAETMEYYNNQPTRERADALTLSGNQVLTVTVVMTRPKTITGIVTDGLGRPLANTSVSLYKEVDFGGAWVEKDSTTTDVNGHYQFSSLPLGHYQLWFSGQGILSEYYNNKSSGGEADILDLTLEPDVVVADAEVTRLGVITGTVTDRTGAPLEGIDVRLHYFAFGDWNDTQPVYTDRDGNYQVSYGRPGTDYRLGFHSNLEYMTEYYSNTYSLDTAQVITIPSETILPNFNAQLERNGLVTGTVISNLDQPLANVTVQAYDSNSHSTTAYYTMTDDEGHYQLILPPETGFLIGFSHASYEAEFYNDQADIDAATAITAPLNTLLPNINAQLAPGPVISGTVTDNAGRTIAGIRIVAYNIYRDPKASVMTDQNGHYAIGLAPGTYRLGFNIDDGLAYNENYVSEYYDDTATLFNDAFDDATDIVLTAGHDLAINAELTIIPSISGEVTDHYGGPVYAEIKLVKHVQVDGVWQWQCCFDSDTTSFIDGTSYRIANIPPGEYRVYFEPDPFGLLLAEYFPNQQTVDTATSFTVTPTSIFTGVNASLEGLGAVVGTVVNHQNQPLPGIVVTRHWIASLTGDYPYSPPAVTTDEDGHFSFLVGNNPNWFLFSDPSGTYAGEWYNNQPNLTSAMPITTASNSTVTVQIELGTSVAITGHVADAAGAPMANLSLGLFTYWPQHLDKWHVLPGSPTSTDAEGNYRVNGLTPGAKYRLRFDSVDGTYFYPYAEPFANGDDAGQGDEIVMPNQLLPNINMTLLKTGEVHADFSGAPRSGTGSLTVNFTDQSLGTVQQRRWDFGDGASSSESNPSHTYTAGIYSVTLTLTGTGYSDVEQKVSYISVSDTPITDLGIAPGNWGGDGEPQPLVGQTLYFSATAGGSNVEYLWDFGDDALATTSTASGQYAQHSYAAAGNYTVTLTASNGVDEKVTTLQLTIGDGVAPVSALALHGPSTTFVQATVSLNATAEGDGVSYSWDFGDGESASGQAVQHSYAAAGTYTVTLTANNSQGEAEVTSPILVKNGLFLPRLGH